MGAEETRAETEKIKVRYGYFLAMGGLAVTALLIVGLVLFRGTSASDTVAIVGAFTSVFGTVIGAFLGVQIGSGDKDKAIADRDNERSLTLAAEKKLEVALAMTEVTASTNILKEWQAQGLVG